MEDALLKYSKEDLLSILPYGEFALQIDSVFEKNNEIFGEKKYSIYSKEFNGHFKDEKILPGIYLLEGMFQMAFFCMNAKKGNELLFVSNAKFRKKVLPGSAVVYKTIYDGNMFIGKAFVNNVLVAECKFA